MAAGMCSFGLRPSLGAAPSGRRTLIAGGLDGQASPHAASLTPSLAAREPCSRLRAAASPSAVEAELASPRPEPFRQTWVAPNPSHLIDDNRAFVEEHRIRGYEAGPDQRTTMITIANLLQEVASNHAVAMWGRSPDGFANDPGMAAKGLIFVMTRMQIQMEHYPRWGDIVEFETWFQEAGKLGAQRDWVLREKGTGRQLGRATSTWVMINMNTRRLSKMPEFIRQKCNWFQRDPPQDAIPPAYTRAKIPEIELPPEITGSSQVARRSDMDMNGHINNVTYLAWALETVPRDVYEGGHHLYQAEIDFRSECHAGDLVESIAGRGELSGALASNGAGPEALTFIHTLRKCTGEHCTELVRARTTWRVGEPPVGSML